MRFGLVFDNVLWSELVMSLPQCEADGLLLLCGSSAQDIGERDAAMSLQHHLQSTGKWSEAQIFN